MLSIRSLICTLGRIKGDAMLLTMCAYKKNISQTYERFTIAFKLCIISYLLGTKASGVGFINGQHRMMRL